MDSSPTRIRTIPVNRPDVKPGDFAAFFNPRCSTRELESYFADWLGGSKSCLFTASGKIAIYLLFKFLDIKGNVVTSPLTCRMALAPIIANNVPLKFADVNPETFNLDVNSLESAIDENTRAVYLVHLGGNPCNLRAIREITSKRNILLIEDCAQALGSSYEGTKVGNFGDYSCFSFSKNAWLCGGGMICSDNKSILEEIRKYQEKLPDIPRGLLYFRLKRDFLESRRGNPVFDMIYYWKFLRNFQDANVDIEVSSYFQKKDVLHRPSNIQASVIRRQLSDIDIRNRRRAANAEYLTALLPENFFPQKVEKASESVYSKYYLLSKIESKKLIKYLMSRGIDAKHLTKSHRFHLQTRFDKDDMFKNCKSIDQCINYKEMHDRIVTLPVSSNMTLKELSYITEILRAAEKGVVK